MQIGFFRGSRGRRMMRVMGGALSWLVVLAGQVCAQAPIPQDEHAGQLSPGEEFSVRWVSQSRQAVRIEAPHVRAQMVECVDSARTGRVRFEYRVCQRRSSWFDQCGGTKEELHTIEFENITESYRVSRDRLGDRQPARLDEIPLRSEALRTVSVVDSLPLASIVDEHADLRALGTGYLQVRVVSSCKGGVTKTLAHISRIITLGLVDMVEERTEWRDFDLRGFRQRGEGGRRSSTE